jgi:hypothetical protein
VLLESPGAAQTGQAGADDEYVRFHVTSLDAQRRGPRRPLTLSSAA